ncbi:MAG: hypothetical protein ACRYG2_01715 [Janthinobacterium lividum]
MTITPMVFALDVVTSAWSAALVLGLRTAGTRAAAEREHATAGPAAASFAGFGTVWPDRRPRLVTGLACLQAVVAAACSVFTVVVALRLVDLGEPGVGGLHALLGVGAVDGGLVAPTGRAPGTLATDAGAGCCWRRSRPWSSASRPTGWSCSSPSSSSGSAARSSG